MLLHYNGHGVPRPSSSGEIWVFNKNYTQYIPLSVYDLQTWLGAPAILVLDCSSAGGVISAYDHFLSHRREEHDRVTGLALQVTAPTPI